PSRVPWTTRAQARRCGIAGQGRRRDRRPPGEGSGFLGVAAAAVGLLAAGLTLRLGAGRAALGAVAALARGLLRAAGLLRLLLLLAGAGVALGVRVARASED